MANDYVARTGGLTGRDADLPDREHVDNLDFANVTADATVAFDRLAAIDGAFMDRLTA